MLAAYHLGPERVKELQAKTKTLGLDPNRWEGNVERVAQITIGDEPVRHVQRVRQYYTGLRMALAATVEDAKHPS